MLFACCLVLIGLVILVYGADIFVDGAASVAHQLGVSPLIIGVIIVGFATSAPEIMVGTISAWQDKTAIAIGNALGSNIANIGLVLGLSVLIIPITVASKTIRKEYGLMCTVTIIAFFLMLDGYLSRWDAIVLLLTLVTSLIWLGWIAKRNAVSDSLSDELVQVFSAETNQAGTLTNAVIKLLLGLIMLLAGAQSLIFGGITIAEFFGISDLVIGLTIVAIGTSLPELAASITSLRKNKADIAIGNILGSNIFNMLAVLGIPALINPDYFPADVLSRDFASLVLLCLLLGLFVFAYRKGRLTRLEGGILLLCFIGYQYRLYLHSIAII